MTIAHFLQWLAMGGYSFFVWSAYGLVFLTFLLVFLGVTVQKKRTWKRLHRWFMSE